MASPAQAKPEKPKKKPVNLRAAWPEIWGLMKPRKGLLMLGFVLMVINRVAGLVLPYSMRYVVDNVVIHKQSQMLLPIVGVVLLATLIQGTTSYTLTQTLSKAAQRLIAELRLRVQHHVGRLPVAYYDANKSGVLVSRIMSDVEGVRNLIGTGLVDFIGGLVTAAIALAMLMQISPRMTSFALAFIAIFALALAKAFGTMRPIFRERGKINAEVTGRLTETLGGVRVVKGYHAEEREHDVFGQGVQRLLDNVLKTLTAVSVMTLSSSVLIGVIGAAVMFFGARQGLAGTLSPGQLLTYIMLLGFMAVPLFGVVNVGTQITEAIAGLERTRELLSEKPEDADPGRTVSLERIQGKIEFRNVVFEYDPGKPVLQDVSFVSQPGTVTALVGSSGSGKSTIIGLVAAFHVPLGGQVLVDGTDLATVRLDSYRTRLGVVLQDSFLFDGSIKENILFSRPESTEEELLAACRIARVDEFAERFKDGYDTIIGERGVKLSGGQRQRVSIARAVLADPRILILDEATSSLDSESEQMIQEGLAYLMKGRTTFVIAHRLSTIRRADQILVVEAGKIVERGTHKTLYALGGRYFELYEKQHGLEANLFLAPGEGDSVEEKAAACAAREPVVDPMRIIRGS
jgi:ABC-type multidrug transport system fused ATPase/permease subunit